MCRGVKFMQNFKDPVDVGRNFIKGTSKSQGGRKRLDVGQIRED